MGLYTVTIFLKKELIAKCKERRERSCSRLVIYITKLHILNCNISAIFGNWSHSVSLFTERVSPKFTLTRDHRQNCPIGQPSTKKWFLGPDKYGPCHKSKEKLGEIRSLLVTLPGTLRVQNFFYLY